MTSAPEPNVRAGWFSDVNQPGTDRFWDGSAWTDQTRPEHPLAAWIPALPSHSATPVPPPPEAPNSGMSVRPPSRMPAAASASAFAPVPRGQTPADGQGQWAPAPGGSRWPS
jgi:hypothetical protein